MGDRFIDELVIADGAELDGVRFEGLKVSYGSLGAGRGEVVYTACEFSDCVLNLNSVGSARFVECRFVGSKIKGWLALNAEFIDCQFSSKLERIVFDRRPADDVARKGGRTVNRYVGNDFGLSEFLDVTFRGGIDLKQQVLPRTGEGFYLEDAEVGYATLLGEVLQLEEPWMRDIIAFLEVRLENSRQGQVQDYVSPRDVLRASRAEEARSLLTDILSRVSERV
ncbi:hypothetical protein ACWIF8_01670 [Micromonospora chalcea]